MATKPSELPKLVVSPGSAHHNSLTSFIEYAKRSNMCPARTTYIGTHYEYTVALSLLRLGFSLLRTGRRGDGGIDLIGHWVLPPLLEPIPVIVQCKLRAVAIGPHHVRELEGAFHATPADWQRKQVLGLLVTTRKATPGVLAALGSSSFPMAFMKVSSTGTIEQFVWNRCANERGLEGVGVTVRHTPKEGTSSGSDLEVKDGKDSDARGAEPRTVEITKEIQLTWIGQPMFADRSELDNDTLKLREGIALAGTGVDAVAGAQRTKRRRRQKEGAQEKTLEPNKGSKKLSSGLSEYPTRSNSESVVPDTMPVTMRKRGRPKGSKNQVKVKMREDKKPI